MELIDKSSDIFVSKRWAVSYLTSRPQVPESWLQGVSQVDNFAINEHYQ